MLNSHQKMRILLSHETFSFAIYVRNNSTPKTIFKSLIGVTNYKQFFVNIAKIKKVN